MSTTELLSCPFCGGEAGHHRREDDHGDADAYSFVMCEDCGACCSNLDTRPEADCVAAWNRRVSQAQQQAPAEPVAWIYSGDIETLEADGWCVVHSARCDPGSDHCADVPLYPAAAAVQPPDDKRALSEISRRALTAEARVRELEEAAAAVQPPVVPLTADEIVSVARRAGFRIVTLAETDTLMRIARAIEAKVRGIGSVPPSDLDSNADSVNQERRSGGGVRTDAAGESGEG